MFIYFWDLLVILAAIGCFIVHLFLKGTYSKFSRIPNSSRMTGRDMAEKILRSNGCYDVTVIPCSGQLTDHYDPSNKTVALSEGVYNDTSIAAIAIAAHECGHAVQHKNNYVPVILRSRLVPVVNLSSRLSFPLILIGIVVNSGISEILIQAGIICFGVAVLFHIVTLPVEFNASARALKIIKKDEALNLSDLGGAANVLSAAAMTYVASMAYSLIELLRLIAISKGGRRRD